jgi:hypothetical protein
LSPDNKLPASVLANRLLSCGWTWLLRGVALLDR